MGNEVDETGQVRYSVTLKEFLCNFGNYIPCKSKSTSLLKNGEKKAILSSQLSILPEISSKFSIAYYHYGNAPMLTIVATATGTSVQILQPNQYAPQYLFFNLKGEKRYFSHVSDHSQFFLTKKRKKMRKFLLYKFLL
jgi:hypothetical protein